MRFTTHVLALTLLAAPAASGAQSGAENDVYDPATFKALKYRMIGPHKGSRVTAVTGIADAPWTYFMGTNGGGLWEDDRRRRELGQHLGRLLRLEFHRRHRRGGFGSGHRLCRHGLRLHPGERLPGRRHLQVERWRRELDPPRTR